MIPEIRNLLKRKEIAETRVEKLESALKPLVRPILADWADFNHHGTEADRERARRFFIGEEGRRPKFDIDKVAFVGESLYVSGDNGYGDYSDYTIPLTFIESREEFLKQKEEEERQKQERQEATAKERRQELFKQLQKEFGENP